MTEPNRATLIARDATPEASPIPWAEAQRLAAEATSYWLATTTAEARPHVRPVLAVWLDGIPHVASGPATRKALNLAGNPQCSLSCQAEGADIVLDGIATQVTDPATLQRAVEAYAATYGWEPTVRDGRLDAVEGAPTAGPPPYDLYRIDLTTAYAFGGDELGPRSTRWSFTAATP